MVVSVEISEKLAEATAAVLCKSRFFLKKKEYEKNLCKMCYLAATCACLWRSRLSTQRTKNVWTCAVPAIVHYTIQGLMWPWLALLTRRVRHHWGLGEFRPVWFAGFDRVCSTGRSSDQYAGPLCRMPMQDYTKHIAFSEYIPNNRI